MTTLKRFMIGLLVALPMISSAEELTCDDLASIANDLEELQQAFRQAENIQEGDEIDRALGILVDALVIVADVEQDDNLYRSIDNLTSAYDRMDGQHFDQSLSYTITNIDRLYRKDCR